MSNEHENGLIKRVSETVLPTKYGVFKAIVYEDEHLALVMGTLERGVPVRIHVENVIGDRFGPGRIAIGESMKLIAKEGCGALLYVRNNGSVDKVGAEILQDLGLSYEG